MCIKCIRSSSTAYLLLAITMCLYYAFPLSIRNPFSLEFCSAAPLTPCKAWKANLNFLFAHSKMKCSRKECEKLDLETRRGREALPPPADEPVVSCKFLAFGKRETQQKGESYKREKEEAKKKKPTLVRNPIPSDCLALSLRLSKMRRKPSPLTVSLNHSRYKMLMFTLVPDHEPAPPRTDCHGYLPGWRSRSRTG